MSIPFTQYLRPDGRTKLVKITRPPAVETLAQQLMDMDLRFECEVLSDDATCSFTVHDPAIGEDIAIELTTNGPSVPEAVDKLVADAARLRGLI